MKIQGLTCWWQKQNKQRGFMLVELLLALAATGMLLVLVTTSLQRSCGVISRLEDNIRLQEGRRHILQQLEKTLGYDVLQLAVLDNARLSCKTLNGNKRLLIYCDKNVLYQKTTTGDGSGINPLSLEETKLVRWLVEPVAADRIRISFTLQSGQHQLEVKQLFCCYNARFLDAS